MKLVFATNNQHKVDEVQVMLPSSLELKTLSQVNINEDIPEDYPTLEGNALQKARYIYEKYGYSCFADDTGLEIEALNGEPGVYSARYAGEQKNSEDNIDKVLAKLGSEVNRKACFRTVIALILEGKEYLFEGRVDGDILSERHGTNGFGYDPIFRPEGFSVSFAEMEMGLKNEISHRGRAVAKLVDFLSKL
jgi:non-canonical purine NTP pyrophosphatase, rdgB/HAM1 family